MDATVSKTVRERLLLAEAHFKVSRRNTRALVRVERNLEKLRSTVERQMQEGMDTGSLQTILRENEARLKSIVESLEEDISLLNSIPGLPEWAEEMSGAVRLHDPMLLSFNSDHSSDEELDPMSAQGPVSNWKSQSSKKILKMTPLGKHEESFKYLDVSDKSHVRQFHAVALCAWTFAVICMVITVGFLTTEFVQSQRNPVIKSEQIPFESMALPLVSVCNEIDGLPSFENFPSAEYPGHPLFALVSFNNLQDPKMPDFRYPEVHNTDYVEESYRGQDIDKCKRDLASMSIDRARNALFRHSTSISEEVLGVPRETGGCSKCFTIGRAQQLVIDRSGRDSPVTLPVNLNAVTSRVYSVCELSLEQRLPAMHSYIAQELTKHMGALVERGILEWDSDMTNTTRTRALMREFQTSIRNYGNMLCNVYFFSGYFYPSEDVGKVSYTWDQVQDTWVSIGEREFSPATHNISTETQFGPGDPETVSRDLFTSRGLELYYERPRSTALIAGTNSRVFLTGHTTSLLYVTRFDREETGTAYEAEVDSRALPNRQVGADRYMSYHVGADFSKFSTTQISKQATMSWPEYVTDVFEFIGLFTGVCIFSMIVAPAQNLV